MSAAVSLFDADAELVDRILREHKVLSAYVSQSRWRYYCRCGWSHLENRAVYERFVWDDWPRRHILEIALGGPVLTRGDT